MKKKIVNVLLSSAIAAAMMFSVTACGSDAGAQDTAADVAESTVAETEEATVAESTVTEEATVAETEEATTAESTVAETETATDAADGKMTLEAWVESDECAQFSEMMNDGLDGMTTSFEVEGDVISMIFTMTEAIDVVDGAEEAMSEYFSNNAAIFEAIRDELIEETGNENTVLKLVYRNVDGSDIYSQEF